MCLHIYTYIHIYIEGGGGRRERDLGSLLEESIGISFDGFEKGTVLFYIGNYYLPRKLLFT
jgi:hypothetical protein